MWPRDDLEASCAGSGERPTEGEPIEWRVFGFYRHRCKTVLLLAAIACIAMLVHYAFNQFLFDLLAVAFQLFATRAYWLPVKYRLDTDGVAISTAEQRLLYRWKGFDSFRLSEGRLTLFSTEGNGKADEGRRKRLILPVDSSAEVRVGEYIRSKTSLLEAT